MAMGVGVAWIWWRPDRAIRVASGLVSHLVCSSAFVSELAPARVYAETVQPMPGMGLLTWALRYEIDAQRPEVRTTVAGAFATRAVFRHGIGCVVVDRAIGEPPRLPAERVVPRSLAGSVLPAIAESTVVEPTDERMRGVLDQAFSELDSQSRRRTTAVVVVHDGRVVAERYAPGYGIDTPLLGWSTTKSVMAALVGILVRQGRLSVEALAPIDAWRGRGDARQSITIDHLLRMTSGLDLEETNSGFDPVSRMLFVEPDMAGFAQQAKLHARPGSVWSYSSGNTLILSRIIRDAVGGHAEDVLAFAQAELFEPLGMQHVTLEFDMTGTPIGSTFMFASARDWARFGVLLLNDGVVGGRQILPTGWVRYMASSTLGTSYGAGIWLGSNWGLPEGSLLANGHLGQRVAVVPSEQLVIVRLGVTHGADRFERLAHDVLAALVTMQPVQ